MNEMQTIELVAGRELDALVAEKVMGWTRCDHRDLEDGLWWCRGDGAHIWPADWTPSTDIAAAWQVVERLVALTNWEVQVFAKRHARYVVHASPFVVTEADTAPLAICRAALAALSK